MSDGTIAGTWVSSLTCIATPMRVEVTTEGDSIEISIFAEGIPRPARFRLALGEALKLSAALDLAALFADAPPREGPP